MGLHPLSAAADPPSAWATSVGGAGSDLLASAAGASWVQDVQASGSWGRKRSRRNVWTSRSVVPAQTSTRTCGSASLHSPPSRHGGPDQADRHLVRRRTADGPHVSEGLSTIALWRNAQPQSTGTARPRRLRDVLRVAGARPIVPHTPTVVPRLMAAGGGRRTGGHLPADRPHDGPGLAGRSVKSRVVV